MLFIKQANIFLAMCSGVMTVRKMHSWGWGTPDTMADIQLPNPDADDEHRVPGRKRASGLLRNGLRIPSHTLITSSENPFLEWWH